MLHRASLILLALGVFASAQTSTTPKIGDVPPLIVQVVVGTQQRNERGSFYKKTMGIQGKLTLEAPSRMLPVPELEATLLIVTMDTQAKYRERREVFKVHDKETMAVPAVKVGDRRVFNFTQSSVSFDAYRDATNVGGETYKYFVFALREKSSGLIVDFKTNNVPFATFLKAHPERREELLGLAKGATFPSELK